MSSEEKPHKRCTERSLAYKQGKVVRRFKMMDVHDDSLFSQLGTSLYTVYTDVVEESQTAPDENAGNSNCTSHNSHSHQTSLKSPVIPAQIMLLATGKMSANLEKPLVTLAPPQQGLPSTNGSQQAMWSFPSQPMSSYQHYQPGSIPVAPLQNTVAQNPMTPADLSRPTGPDIPRPAKALKPNTDKVTWDRDMAENYADSYSDLMSQGKLYPKFKDKEDPPEPTEEPTSDFNLFNLASLMNLPVSTDILESARNSTTDMDLTKKKKESEPRSSLEGQDKVLNIAECFVDFTTSVVSSRKPINKDAKSISDINSSVGHLPVNKPITASQSVVNGSENESAIVEVDAVSYTVILFCDLCHVKLTESSADEHLQLYKHYSASLYNVPVSTECESITEMPVGSRVLEAEKFVNPVHIRDLEMICVCLPCNRQIVAHSSPISMSAHCMSHKQRNSEYQDLKHFAYCEARGDDFVYEIDLKNLKKCYKSDQFLCVNCQKTFPSSRKAIIHMTDEQHTPMANDKWRPIHSRTQRTTEAIKELVLVYCVDCDVAFSQYSQYNILKHLNVVHGASYEESTADRHTVSIIYRTYDLVKMSNSLKYVSEEVQESVDSRYQAQQKEINRMEADMHKRAEEPEQNEGMLVKALPTDPDCRTGTEFMCDLCHRLLGRSSDDARRHMSKYQHPSVSRCNTVAHPNKEAVPYSIIDGMMFFTPRYADNSLICTCPVDQCERITSDPYTMYLHQQIIHRLSSDQCSINYYVVESISDYIITVDNMKQPHICEKCGEAFAEKEELLRHIAVRGHEILSNKPGSEKLEIARCLICSALDTPISQDSPKFLFRSDDELLSHLQTHVTKRHSRLERGDTIELSYAIQTFRLERSKVPLLAFSSEESLDKMKEKTVSTILHYRKNISRHEYAETEQFMAKLRLQNNGKGGRKERSHRRTSSRD